MGALRKTMEYLGLAETEEHFDDYYEDEADPQAEAPRHLDRTAGVTPLPQRTPIARVVRDPELGSLNRITTIHPRTYNDAKSIGESFREGIPVIMNLTDMNDVDAKRLVDFAAGLIFGLHGAIDRVTSKVFLLTPANVDVQGGGDVSADTPFNQS